MPTTGKDYFKKSFFLISKMIHYSFDDYYKKRHFKLYSAYDVNKTKNETLNIR